MRPHPYVRAYLAGIAAPTLILLLLLALFVAVRLGHRIPEPLERFVVFPMAIVPNLWGLWNMLYVALPGGRRWPLGIHGAVMPFLLAPGGWLMTRLLSFPVPGLVWHLVPYAFPFAVIVYYLAWKHIVGRLNAIIGIA